MKQKIIFVSKIIKPKHITKAHNRITYQVIYKNTKFHINRMKSKAIAMMHKELLPFSI